MIILSCLHFEDNEIIGRAAKKDTYAKLRSFIDHLRCTFIRYWFPEENIGPDELTIAMWQRFAATKQLTNKKAFHGLQGLTMCDDDGCL